MDISFNLTANAGSCRHWKLGISHGAKSKVVTFGREDLTNEPDDLTDEAFLLLMRHIVKTAGATTFAQAKTALEGKVFKI